MQGASRASLAVVREEFRADPATSTDLVGSQLLSVASLLGRETSLRNALTDNGSTPERRVELARSIFTDKVAPQTVSVLATVVAQRWSPPRDLVEVLEILGAEALLAHAEADGRIDTVEEELFRFSRILESSPDLQLLLSDPAVAPATKSTVIADLLADKVQPETVTLVTHAGAHALGRPMADRLHELVQLAAARRQQLLADVRAPMPLTEEQTQRLSAALQRIYGHEVTVAVSVDPDVLGGAVVRIGDEIIDGSIASRMAAARRSLTQ
ncbi:MAG: F0F1 ATP synthase subunit delta [Jiangellales bacterium]